MRYPASEKLEIIRLVEQSHLPVRRALEKLGIPRATYYLYGLLPCRKRVSRVPRPGRLAYLYPASRTASGARMANPRAGTSTAGRPTLAWPR
jgi:hypothetical protein